MKRPEIIILGFFKATLLKIEIRKIFKK